MTDIIFCTSNSSDEIIFPNFTDLEFQQKILIACRDEEFSKLTSSNVFGYIDVLNVFAHFVRRNTISISYEGCKRVLDGFWFYWRISVQ